MFRVAVAVAAILASIGRASASHIDSVYLPGEAACPAPCNVSGPNPDNWTVYHSLARLGICDKPVILTFNVFHALDDPDVAAPSIRACTSEEGKLEARAHQPRSSSGPRLRGRQFDNSNSTTSNSTSSTPEQQAQAGWKETSARSDGAQVIALSEQLRGFLGSMPTEVSASLGPSLFFVHQSDIKTPELATSLAIYAASGVSTSPLIDAFVEFTKTRGYGGESLVQACGGVASFPAALGIAASTGPQSLVAAQQLVRQWANSSCAALDSSYETSTLAATLHTVALSSPDTNPDAAPSARSAPDFHPGTPFEAPSHPHSRRADACRTVDVAAGNLCADLARKCGGGLTVEQLLRFNPQPNFCTTLKVPQKVCCTAGGLPIPKPDANGNCATYKVVPGDSCWSITQAHLISVADIENFNKNTWGWGTCNNLQANTLICLSTGAPPLPLPVPGAVCGPIKPGTTRPPAGTSLASLNPCPLNSCCGVWGYCGTTDEFCRPIPAGQAPGAPQPAGGPICISNCGTDIVNNASPPPSFFTIGYFEGYGLSRACDKVDIRTIDTKKYTHIHFAFATITPNTFEVDMGPTINQFYYFKQLTGFKKILAFGGWTFSTDPATYGIFRAGVLSANRQRMAQNIANFIVSNNLDGVDIDWEYPAAPDLPDIPSADPLEGENYLEFMRILRGLLPREKSLSFAAPASFWYLQGFPIARIMQVVDYVIYMTYDLHGQWDYGKPWGASGCPAGNCLQSHVNMTETMNALSMITKAGVPANKIVVGVTSYGRSFQMTTPGCTGPTCTYTGPASGATPGKCTDTAGYLSNAEIREILATNPTAKTTFDRETETDILVYNSTQWVGYMRDNNKEARKQRYRSLNFLGTTDWAISLDNAGLTAPIESELGPGESYFWPQNAVDPRLHKSCNPFKDMILEAWEEAGELSKAPAKWSRWNKYQGALNDYLGPRSGQVPIFSSDHIWYNFKRHIQAHTGGQGSQRGIYNYYYCDQDAVPGKGQFPPPGPCRYDARRKSGVAAVTYRSPGRVWSEYHTLLCPWWLGQINGAPQFTSLKAIAREADGFAPLREKIDRWSNTVRALTIHHETVHWQDISWPHCNKEGEIYAPEAIVGRSRNQGRDGYEANLRTAHAWTLTTTAIWMMQRWSRIGVPQPQRPIPSTVGSSDDHGEGQWWTEEFTNAEFDASRVNPADFTRMSQHMPGSGFANECVEGRYEFQDQCEMMCNLGVEGRKCSKNSDDTWQCKNCDSEPSKCEPGLYSDWDKCNASCKGGACSLNAGEDGIRCTC
ncbi:killer toxin subunits alpha/beta-like protein [Podospora aff. communis PSN243]|uniref:chitinase n=1 Tax=Podospora aff. communis PSN243 TaxID=3040156 RepID=A0AAV9GQJ9_9PEZI|nr:killer toxin subunits alpha/beta-like protein [Podospora aff. communis PSN243]